MNELEELPFPPDDEPFESDRATRTADSYEAVHRGNRVLLLRDQHPLPKKHAEALAPQGRDLEILRALWRYRFLLTSQIADEWWAGKSLYAAQRRLLRMTAAGWVTRFRPRLSKGKHEWIYQLDRAGFDLGKRCWGLDGPYIEEEAKWRPRHITDYSVVEHDLQGNACHGLPRSSRRQPDRLAQVASTSAAAAADLTRQLSPVIPRSCRSTRVLVEFASA